MINWKNNRSLPIAIASATIGLMAIGGWIWNEKRQINPSSSQTKELKEIIDSFSTQPQKSIPLPVEPKKEQVTLTLLGDTFSGYSTFRSYEFYSSLSQVGINLKYRDEFNQTKRAELLNQNHADIYVTTLDQFIKQKPQGKIVGLVDRTVGADAVVLNSKKYPFLKSLQGLEKLKGGEKIAYAADTPSEYLALVLDTQFEAFNLSRLKSQKVVDASMAWELFKDLNLAVAILWEPYVTMARKQGYTVALSSQDAPTAIIDVIVASNSIIKSKPQVVSDFLKAYYRRIDRLHREPNLLKEQIAADARLSEKDTDAVVGGIDFFTSVEANQWMNDGTLIKRMGAIAAVLTLSGKIEQIPENFHSLYTGEFVDSAVQQTQQLIALVRQDNPELAQKLSGQTIAVPPVTATQKVTTQAIGNLQVRGEIQFATSSAFLTAAGIETVSRLAQQIQEFNPDTVAVSVVGHTSKTGDSAFNQHLSNRRAQTVASALKQAGVKNKIVATGKGDTEPLPGVLPSDVRNQRTEIRLVRLN